MPIRKTQTKGPAPPPTARERTGDYSLVFSPPQPYKAIQPEVPIVTPSWAGSIPSISSRDLGYFFNLASSLYDEKPVSGIGAASGQQPSPSVDVPPAYGQDFQNTALDPSAILVIWLFRQTRIDIHPIAERFHLGPADRQPLYSLTGQPSIRSATEFNELAIQRRDPIKGIWHNICTSDIEPSLDLVKPGSWRVAKLVMTEAPASAKRTGKSLSLSWGDRKTLGCLGDAYGLWWETGVEGGLAEAFYVIEGWKGFDSHPQGVIRVKPPVRGPDGQYQDPRLFHGDLAVVYFHPDGKTPPQFVCSNVDAQIRLDIIMSGLMTVLVIETRKALVIKEFGALPAYDSVAHWKSPLVEEGQDVMGQ